MANPINSSGKSVRKVLGFFPDDPDLTTVDGVIFKMIDQDPHQRITLVEARDRLREITKY